MHRVDDIHTLSAARFFTWTERLPAYRGALRGRYEAELAEAETAPATGGSAPSRARPEEVPLEVAVKQDSLRGDGFMFPDVIEYGRG